MRETSASLNNGHLPSAHHHTLRVKLFQGAEYEERRNKVTELRGGWRKTPEEGPGVKQRKLPATYFYKDQVIGHCSH